MPREHSRKPNQLCPIIEACSPAHILSFSLVSNDLVAPFGAETPEQPGLFNGKTNSRSYSAA
jgi:hypothetical protein